MDGQVDKGEHRARFKGGGDGDFFAFIYRENF